MGTGVAVQPRPQPPPRPRTQQRPRIAFVCVGNSCRSPMAEGWARHLGKGEVEAMSAGLHPLGYITPETVQVMEEKKVSLAGQRSKGLEEIDWQGVDVLVNMTLLPAASIAPAFQGLSLNWVVPDPFGAPLDIFRKVRDQLEREVEELLKRLSSSSSGPAAPSVV